MSYKEYCLSEKQLAICEHVESGGNPSSWAKSLGLSERDARASWQRVKARAALAGYAPEQGFSPSSCPSGFRLDKSTVHIKDGELIQRWDRVSADKQAYLDAMQSTLSELAEGIKPVDATPLARAQYDDLINVIPVADAHIGMLSMSHDWGVSKALKTVAGCVKYCVEHSPKAKRALVLFVGDIGHFDSMKPVTPKNKNVLEASVLAQDLPAAVRDLCICAIGEALKKHEHVDVVIVPGNHDPYGTVFLRILLDAVYANEPRVNVSQDTASYQGYLFGKTFIGVNHGDRRQGAKVAEVFSGDEKLRKLWGRARHSYIFTADKHTEKVDPVSGGTVIRLNTLAGMSSYEEGGGWRSSPSMKAFSFDKEGVLCAQVQASPWNIK